MGNPIYSALVNTHIQVLGGNKSIYYFNVRNIILLMGSIHVGYYAKISLFTRTFLACVHI